MPTEPKPKRSFADNDLIFLILIFALSLFVCWPLFKEDFITTIDGGDHLLRLYSMNLFIGHGQWYVRWIPYLHGYGYPEFNFYPPLAALVGTALVKIGLSYIWSLNMACYLFVLLAGLTMYYFAKELWGPQGGFLSAGAYMLAPYLMVDVYARGDYAETAAFVFLPLILLAFLKLNKEFNVFYMLIAAFSVAGLFLANNCITVIFCPVIFLFILVLHFPFDRRQRFFLLVSLFTFGLGIGLACFYWLPALIEKNYVHLERMLQGSLDFHNDFLSLQQLIYSPWPKKSGTGLPCEIGPVHLLLALIGLCFIPRIIKDRKSLIKPYFFLFFILIISIFMTLSPSLIIWDHIHILKFIQFPLRFLVLITFMVSVLAGGCSLILPKHRWLIMTLGVLAIFIVGAPRCHPPYGSEKVNLKNIPPSFVFRNLHSQDGGEFIPQWVQEVRTPVPFENLEVVTGNATILSRQEVPEVHQRFSVEALSPTLLCFNVFYFPGWTVKVDGQMVTILKDNPYGLIVFPVNEGLHEIKVDFGPTPLRRAATVVSFLSFIILLGILFFTIIRKIIH